MVTYTRAARLRPGPPGRTAHQVGLPTELDGTPVPMPDPTFIVIHPAEQGFLFERFADIATMAGDTWHETEQDARDQAAWEYGERLRQWIDLTDGTTDLTDVVAQLDRVTFDNAE
jgi:hypothetical protein